METETKTELFKPGMRAPGKFDKPDKPAAAGNGRQAAALTLMDRINEMAQRDAEDWRYLADSLRKFVAQRRADLDYLERLLGTK